MNCKQGDFAYVKWAGRTPEVVGRFVTVVRPLLKSENFLALGGRVFICDAPTEPAWVIESETASPLPWRDYDGTLHWCKQRAIYDSCLRPIRDQPGEDEMLTRVGKPRGSALDSWLEEQLK